MSDQTTTYKMSEEHIEEMPQSRLLLVDIIAGALSGAVMYFLLSCL